MFDCIASTPSLVDIVVSGGDSYYLQPEHITEIGHRLLSIPHIRRFRFATKGLAVSPMRILTDDAWTNALLEVSDQGKKMGKAVAVHTHFNHPKEITWVTKVAAQKLFERGVMVRNQTVLLKGVNDDVETMKELIRGLADINIQPVFCFGYHLFMADFNSQF
jgi:lysine 2,3-aminomutase